MDIKLVIADIDGTFLDSKNQPSRGAVEAIAEIRRRGIEFTLCSGRGDPGVRPFVKFLNLTQPYIVSGGAGVLSSNGAGVIHQDLLGREKIARITQFGMETRSDVFFHTAREIFIIATDDFWVDVQSWEWMRGFAFQYVHRVQNWQETPVSQVIRMDIFNRLEALPELALCINNLNIGLHTTIMRRNIEVTNRHVTKGSAIEFLATYLHITLENIMAIGDGMNDLSMLEKAGLGIAMQNSSDQVKVNANCVAPSSDDGGLAWALQKLQAGDFNNFPQNNPCLS